MTIISILTRLKTGFIIVCKRNVIKILNNASVHVFIKITFEWILTRSGGVQECIDVIRCQVKIFCQNSGIGIMNSHVGTYSAQVKSYFLTSFRKRPDIFIASERLALLCLPNLQCGKKCKISERIVFEGGRRPNYSMTCRYIASIRYLYLSADTNLKFLYQ